MKKLLLITLILLGAGIAVANPNTYRLIQSGSFVGTATADLDMGGLYDVIDLMVLDFGTVSTIAADDVTPDVSGASVFITSANTGATVITDLDSPRVGQMIYLVGGSAVNSSSIADSGNFNLDGGIILGVDQVLVLYVQADNDYIEITRNPKTGSGANSTAVNCVASATDSTCFGNSADATGTTTLAVGDDAQATANGCTAVGSNSVCTTGASTVLGTSASSTAGGNVIIAATGSGGVNNQIVIGYSTFASASGAVCIGHSSAVEATDGVAIGRGAEVNAGATNSIAIGRLADVGTRSNCLAVGLSAVCAANNEGQLGTATQPYNIKLYGTLDSARTTDLGWTPAAAANQACNTTCTSACVAGWDTLSVQPLLCTDATADYCLCAGGS